MTLILLAGYVPLSIDVKPEMRASRTVVIVGELPALLSLYLIAIFVAVVMGLGKSAS